MRVKGNISVNGISVLDTLAGEYLTIKEFITNVVLQNEEDAKAIIFSIAPLVFRIKLSTLTFDIHEDVEVIAFSLSE